MSDLKKDAEKLALNEQAKKEDQQREQVKLKKDHDLNNIKFALELGLKNGAYSTLEEMTVIINSFEGLR